MIKPFSEIRQHVSGVTTDFWMGRLVQYWPLIHGKKLNASQKEESALALVSWPFCSCWDWGKGDPGSPARLALTQVTGESALMCWLIAVTLKHFSLLSASTCVQREGWVDVIWASRRGSLGSSSPIRGGQNQRRGGHLLNLPSCTVAASFWALSFLPASFLVSHPSYSDQVLEVLPQFSQCSLTACRTLSSVHNYLVLKSFIYQSIYFNLCLWIYLLWWIDKNFLRQGRNKAPLGFC